MATQNEVVSQRIKDSFIEEYNCVPLHKISVKKLCENAGIARTSFYSYYADVYELLEEIEDEIICRLQEINSTFPDANFRETYSRGTFGYFHTTLSYVKEKQTYFRVLLGRRVDNQFVYKWKKIIKADFRKKYEQERIQIKNLDLVLNMIASAAIGTYEYWLFHMDSITEQDIADEVLDKLCQDFTK